MYKKVTMALMLVVLVVISLMLGAECIFNLDSQTGFLINGGVYSRYITLAVLIVALFIASKVLLSKQIQPIKPCAFIKPCYVLVFFVVCLINTFNLIMQTKKTIDIIIYLLLIVGSISFLTMAFFKKTSFGLSAIFLVGYIIFAIKSFVSNTSSVYRVLPTYTVFAIVIGMVYITHFIKQKLFKDNSYNQGHDFFISAIAMVADLVIFSAIVFISMANSQTSLLEFLSNTQTPVWLISIGVLAAANCVNIVINIGNEVPILQQTEPQQDINQGQNVQDEQNIKENEN